VITPEEAIERIGARFGVHSGRRALHARGIVVGGSFTASAEGGALTTAAHMSGEVTPVIARFSNGSGDPDEPDKAPDVRGLAIRFELPGGDRTDIVAQTAPRFPVKSPDAFVDLIEATARGPQMLVKLPLFLAKNPGAVGALRANASALRPPRSYSTPAYFAVHAYRWIAPDGTSRWVRYTLSPASEQPELAPDREVPDYLSAELRDRFEAGGTVTFDLDLELAGDGDDPHDPTAVWKSSERVIAGRLELDHLVSGREDTIFDPMRLTEGIEPSDDPILRYRPRAYGVSYAQRTGDPTEPPSWAR
jgi:catalase